MDTTGYKGTVLLVDGSIDFIATHALGVPEIHKINQSQTINLTLTIALRSIPSE
jgi:hypothetical protein